VRTWVEKEVIEMSKRDGKVNCEHCEREIGIGEVYAPYTDYTGACKKCIDERGWKFETYALAVMGSDGVPRWCQGGREGYSALYGRTVKRE